jgi:hypothetical protein
MGLRGPRPVCVGCDKQKDDCRKTIVGMCCGPCRMMLKEVIRWQHESRFPKATSDRRPHRANTVR